MGCACMCLCVCDGTMSRWTGDFSPGYQPSAQHITPPNLPLLLPLFHLLLCTTCACFISLSIPDSYSTSLNSTLKTPVSCLLPSFFLFVLYFPFHPSIPCRNKSPAKLLLNPLPPHVELTRPASPLPPCPVQGWGPQLPSSRPQSAMLTVSKHWPRQLH